jgi:RND family efflux transporter MFP subunit
MQSRDLTLTLCLTLALALPFAGCQERSALARLPDKPEPANVAATTLPADVTGGNAVAPAEKSSPVLSGSLEPHRRSTLMPKVGGWVVKVHCAEGDIVRRGAPLVTIDQEQYRLILRQAEAGYEGAKVGLDATKIEWDRHKALLADKAVPQSQWDMIDSKYKGALVQLKAAEVSLEQARKAMRDTVVHAPYTGVVIKKHVAEGDNAAAMPPTPLITLEETETLDLRVQVPASDFEHVKQGDDITVHFPDGPPDLKAKITRVVPTINPGTRTFPVIVEIDNTAGKLRAGLFAEVHMSGVTPPAVAAPSAKGVKGAKSPKTAAVADALPPPAAAKPAGAPR